MTKLKISDTLSLPMDVVTSTLVVYGGKGMGKRLALDTKLPTPTGWTTMGTVKVGDTLFNEGGEQCHVSYVSPIAIGDSYRVQFSDGSFITADAEHLWSTEDYRARKRGTGPQVRTTVEIRDTLITMQGTQQARTHSIRNTLPLCTAQATLRVDPYVFGLWLGHGSVDAPVFGIGRGDEELVAALEKAGYPTRLVNQSDSTKAPLYYVRKLKSALRDLGVLAARHIPPQYLRASAEQRLALLQGLMDTSGGWSETSGNVAEFSSESALLSGTVCEVVVSLGMKAVLKPRPSRLNSVAMGMDYRVRFVPTIQVFRLERKRVLCRFDGPQEIRRTRRYITNVSPVDSVPMRCIAVDSPSHLYLAGEAMIPTHNTNLGSVLVEELAKAGLRWAVLDPLGVWWGLRHAKNGKGPGIECLILGGVHGDIPIEPTGGAVVADLVVDEPASVIIDFSRKPSGEMWGIGEKTRFITDYALRLFQRQGGLVDGHRREPIFQVLDEAARYIPQMFPAGNQELAKCLSAWNTLVEEGRNVGIGVGLLTQRSARMNKSVSELADAMFSFRIVGPNSIEAVTDWLGEHVSKARIKEHVESLRSLERGRCLVVSPGWLQFEGTVMIRERETFDSSATPKPGEKARRVTGAAAKPDLAAYAERMRATIERVKENDPAALKRRIVELEKQARQAGDAKVISERNRSDIKPDPERVKVAVEKAIRAALKDRDMHWTRSLRDYQRGIESALEKMAKEFGGAVRAVGIEPPLPIGEISADVSVRSIETVLPANPRREVTSGETRARAVRPAAAPSAQNNGHQKLSRLQIKILSRLMELLDATQSPAVPKEQLAAWSGYSPTGGGYNNYLGSLRSAGMIDYPQPGLVAITDDGEKVAEPDETPTTDEEMLLRAEKILGGSEGRLLRAVAAIYPDFITKNQLAEITNFSSNGGGFNNYLGHMRTSGFITYPQVGCVRAADWLFVESEHDQASAGGRR